jgi:hypothetical protein
MTAAELRIGNWVTYNPESVDEGTEIIPLNVEEILSGGVRLSDGFDNTYYFDEILPIPLSPELLEAIGFKKNNKRGTYVIEFTNSNDCRIILFIGIEKENADKPFMFWGLQDVSFDSVVVEKIIYLHQLQNLFYSLTGEELSIDLNKINVHSTNK